MNTVREALEQRGFKLADYQDREEQLRDVVRGLGRAADDVASTIPAVDGACGGGVFATRAHWPPPYQKAFDETERALERVLRPGPRGAGYLRLPDALRNVQSRRPES